jgi:hypothetical protein
MAMTPEAAVKAKVRKILQSHKVYHFMPAANGYGRVGIPDFICCVNGKFLGIECKAGGNKPTALQKLEIEAIIEAGGTALVVNEENLADLAKVVETLKQS